MEGTLTEQVLHRNIKALRKSLGISQVELARLIGIKQSGVSKIERGIQRPGIERLPILADVLGVTVDELLRDPSSN